LGDPFSSQEALSPPLPPLKQAGDNELSLGHVGGEFAAAGAPDEVISDQNHEEDTAKEEGDLFADDEAMKEQGHEEAEAEEEGELEQEEGEDE